MLNKRLILSGLFILTITLSNFVSAASIVNGTFNSDLSGWSTVTNGGTVQWDVSGKAVLLTGSDAAIFSSALVQGDDGFFSFSDPIVLGSGDDSFKFDFDFSTLVADALETATSLFNDNLKVWLYDADSLGDVLERVLKAATRPDCCVARYSKSSCTSSTFRFLRSVRLALEPLATLLKHVLNNQHRCLNL